MQCNGFDKGNKIPFKDVGTRRFAQAWPLVMYNGYRYIVSDSRCSNR